MKTLIVGNIHKKNKEGIISILKYLNWEYKFGDISEIDNYELIYLPDTCVNVEKYPNKKFIFGPHFSVFPDNKIGLIKKKLKNCVYIQPSEWASNVWINMGVGNLRIETFPFPVNTVKFNESNKTRDKVFIYFKNRKYEELEFLEKFLESKNVNYKIFNYGKRYEENDYLNYLQQSKYGIVLDAHESQGFAIEEAMSCNVPLLIWNAKTMKQCCSNYPDYSCSTIPYWDETCGNYFYKKEEFLETFEKFINNLEKYKPREFILKNLSVDVCSNRFIKLVSSL